MPKGQTRKRVPVAHHLRRFIATNARARAQNVFAKTGVPVRSEATAIYKASLAGGHKLSLSQIKRILNGDKEKAPEDQKLSVSIDQLNALALTLDLLPYQLLLDGLDAANPQVAHGASETEKQAYVVKKAVEAAIPSLVKEVLERTTPPRRR